MHNRLLICTLALLTGVTFTLPDPADGQLLKRLGRAATNAAQREVENKIARMVSSAVRCVLDDLLCYEKAKAAGEEVIFVDDEGEIITDDEGVPVTDPDEARETAPAPDRPGEGVWANYDFVPGDDILFYDDWSDDRVGDFPRRLEFRSGNWEVVDWEGKRLLRNTGPRASALEIPLPRALPDRFTIEMDVHFPHGNQRLVLGTHAPEGGYQRLEGNYFQIGVAHGSGVLASSSNGVTSTNETPVISERVAPFRVMVDDRYAKVYVGSRRVANVPNAELRRGEALYIENVYMADEENPMYIGAIRIAAGGSDLYDDLSDDGRAITRGILFAVNSDRIRPESTPTLEEIAGVLSDHADLRLRIEGHTDADGEDAYNQDLSERRAAAVKAYLVEHGIDASRLETAGLGEAQPVAGNDSPAGRQQNRRVELVRIE